VSLSKADTSPSRPWPRRLAWAIVAVIVVLLPANIVLVSLTGNWIALGQALPFFTFPIVGAVLALKRPSNPLGWLMLAIGLVWALPFELYANYALHVRHGAVPGGAYALAISGPGWVPFIGLSGFMLLLFPDGHVPSPRWRWFAWVCGVGLVLLFLVILFSPGRFTDSGYPRVSNPLGIDAIRPFFGPLLALVASAPLIVLGGAVAVVVRMRRSRDEVERHQLRWLAWTASVIAALYLLAFVPNALLSAGWANVFGNIAVFAFALIPVTIGIAVLRYRLYDIDLVIRKTVIVAAIAVLFTVVYLAVVGGIGAIVQSRSTTVLSFVAAAVVAALFQPALGASRRIADQIVYGRRATPYEVLAAFGGRLGDAYATEDVLGRMAQIMGTGVGATTARVWLRVGSELRPAAAWPADRSDVASLRVRDDAPNGRIDGFSVQVRDGGELLGALSVETPANDPMTVEKEKLVRDLASQAGLVLRNVRLVEELKASQRRIVAAQDQERRRIERNIHDGAQQQLVALAVKARLARSLVDRDPAKTGEMLDQIGAETQEALEDLRDLARGIYPPLLADKGLAAALEAQARKAAVPVEISPDGVGRYAQEVEAAVYFSILEAIQNASKYAGASAVSVRLERANDELTFEVSDDGGGFDPDVTSYGTGLQGIADRLRALDGTFEVRSSPGSGTILAGVIPVDRRTRRKT
jgi:signal transduction histidine kinase